MMDLVHLLADLVVTGSFHHAIAVKRRDSLLYFPRIMNCLLVWSFGSTVMTMEAGYTMCVPLD